MKKIAVITTSKELKEFQERTDIRILDINVKACDQTWATQEYFVATIVYDDDLNSDPDYWTRLEHQYAGMAMQGILSNSELFKATAKNAEEFGLILPQAVAIDANCFAQALVEKLKELEERK